MSSNPSISLWLARLEKRSTGGGEDMPQMDATYHKTVLTGVATGQMSQRQTRKPCMQPMTKSNALYW
jgi:hypothetical protein